MRIQAHIVTLSIPHNQAIYPTSNTIFTFSQQLSNFLVFHIKVGKISAKKSAKKLAENLVKKPLKSHSKIHKKALE
jgi:hypothetical protein